MGWHETRVQWNKDGQCAREACRASLEDGKGVHRHTKLEYCLDCTALINKHNPEAEAADGKPLVERQ